MPYIIEKSTLLFYYYWLIAKKPHPCIAIAGQTFKLF